MRRSSSTWRSSLLLLLVAAGNAGAAGRPWLCLPSAYDHGERLHAAPAPDAFWLQLALRQHEVCWHRPRTPDELRVFLLGNSGVFGHHLPARETVAHLLDSDLDARGVPAHVFNLAWVAAYQMKDALILHEALRYRPDAIVFSLTPSDFRHDAPIVFPTLSPLFDANADAMLAFAHEHPPGLGAILDRYRQLWSRVPPHDSLWDRLRQLGTFVRSSVRQSAQRLPQLWIPGWRPPQRPPKGRQRHYDCGDTRRRWIRSFTGWQDWNVLAWLERVQRTTGVPVLVVSWPLAHEPVGACYNVRYTDATVRRFLAWLRAETSARDLAFTDLHALLAPTDFIDSLHLTAAGHRKMAKALARALQPLLERVEQQRAAAG